MIDISGIQIILFDWGDTLMEDLGLPGPMFQWPSVRTYDDVPLTIEYLASKYRLGVATNAGESNAAAVRKALDRVGIGRHFGPIYSSGDIGYKKPQPEFFDHVMSDLGIDQDRLCMVGDSFANDVYGVAELGIRAFWLSRGGSEIRRGHGYTTIHSLNELKRIL